MPIVIILPILLLAIDLLRTQTYTHTKRGKYEKGYLLLRCIITCYKVKYLVKLG